MQLEILKEKCQKNIMSDFNLEDCKITNVKINGNVKTIEVQLRVSFRDYVVDNNNTVVRGNKDCIYNMTYLLTFTKKLNDINNKCPKCETTIENILLNKCPYCRAIIKIDNNEFVMCKKTLLSQRNK